MKDREEPKSARATKEYYRLWKFAETLKPEEIQCLISKRRDEINNEMRIIKRLRTEISILEDTNRIIGRKLKEKNKYI